MGRGGGAGGGAGRGGGGGRSGGFSSGGSRGMSGGGNRSGGSSAGRGGGRTGTGGMGGSSGRSGGGTRPGGTGSPMGRSGGGARPGGTGSPMGRSGGGARPGGMGTPMGGPRPGGGPAPRRTSGGFGAGMGRRRRPRAGRPRRSMGCSTGCLFPSLLALIIIVMVIASGVTLFRGSSSSSEGDGITRTKLESDQCITSSEWIDDELGWFEKPSTVQNAMQSFYNDTGVQPYLILTDNMDGKGYDLTDTDAEEYLDAVYDSLYSDEGHMIFAFVEYDPSEYVTYIYTGTAAASVIDSSARELILGLADRYYTDTSLSDESYFATIFTTSAEELMQDYNSGRRTRNTIIIIVVVGLVLIGILYMVKRVADSRAKEAERTKEILDTPIGESPEDEELLKKYGEDSDKKTDT